MQMRKGHQTLLPSDQMSDEWTKKDHKRHYGPYPGGKPENFNNLPRPGPRLTNLKHLTQQKRTKHAPGDRFVKRDTRKLKEAVVEKYHKRCPVCHKWFSDQQYRGHGHG
jgi:hypothetical protein